MDGGATLDYDIINEFGAENVTVISPFEGRYNIAINYYGYSSGTRETTVDVQILLNENTGSRTYNEYSFILSEDNANSGYPVTDSTDSWFRPTDILVDQYGISSIVTPVGSLAQ